MLSSEIVQRVHNAVCAIGLLPVPLEEWRLHPHDHPFQVVGTGFLAKQGTVMTNQHVLEAIVSRARKRNIPDSQLFVSFVAPSRAPKPIKTLRMIRRTHAVELGEIDVGMFQILPQPESHFEAISPLVPSESSPTVSQEVFICGYPYTNLLLQPTGRPSRDGPVVQQGFISGLAPYAGADAPTDLLLDVRTAPGMSGSPVVDSSSGQVVGIHYEAVEDESNITTTTFAIPVTKEKLSAWLKEFDEYSE